MYAATLRCLHRPLHQPQPERTRPARQYDLDGAISVNCAQRNSSRKTHWHRLRRGRRGEAVAVLAAGQSLRQQTANSLSEAVIADLTSRGANWFPRTAFPRSDLGKGLSDDPVLKLIKYVLILSGAEYLTILR